MRLYLSNGKTLESFAVQSNEHRHCWWMTWVGTIGTFTTTTARPVDLPNGGRALVEMNGSDVDVYAKGRAIEDALNGH